MWANVVEIFQITYATSREQKLNNKWITIIFCGNWQYCNDLSTGIKMKITEYAFKPEHISSHFLLYNSRPEHAAWWCQGKWDPRFGQQTKFLKGEKACRPEWTLTLWIMSAEWMYWNN